MGVPSCQPTVLVNLGCVGVNVVGLNHSLCSKNLGTLVVSVGRLAAHVNHGLDAIGVTDEATGGVKLL